MTTYELKDFIKSTHNSIDITTEKIKSLELDLEILKDILGLYTSKLKKIEV